MAKYIEREAILDLLKNKYQDMSAMPASYYTGFQYALKTIEKIKPAADVAQVRHGRLVSTGYDELYCEFGDCTICGADNPISSRYCRQCGAKMDLEG